MQNPEMEHTVHMIHRTSGNCTRKRRKKRRQEKKEEKEEEEKEGGGEGGEKEKENYFTKMFNVNQRLRTIKVKCFLDG